MISVCQLGEVSEAKEAGEAGEAGKAGDAREEAGPRSGETGEAELDGPLDFDEETKFGPYDWPLGPMSLDWEAQGPM